MDFTAFDPFRVSETLLADAYEAVSPQQRAWLKTTQSLVQSVYGESPTHDERRFQPAGSGFAHGVCTIPVEWTFVLVGGQFAAPCRLSAALMAARLAGVESILVFFADDTAHTCPAVFAACELAGVESLYALSIRTPSPENLSLFDALLTLPPSHGRVLTFGAMAGFPLPFPAWRDTPPRAAIAPGCDLTEHDLRDAHPDAFFVPPNSRTRPDVLYSADSCLDPCDAPLCLGPGLEGAWLHVGLLPGFFKRTSMRLVRTDI